MVDEETTERIVEVLDEARSWGKLERDARSVSVYADATITLPLVVAAARDRVDGD